MFAFLAPESWSSSEEVQPRHWKSPSKFVTNIPSVQNRVVYDTRTIYEDIENSLEVFASRERMMVGNLQVADRGVDQGGMHILKIYGEKVQYGYKELYTPYQVIL